MEKILSVSNITIGIRKKKIILTDINFSLFKSEFLVILGPNGIGKSSFLKALLGNFDIFKGSVLLLDKEISKYTCATRAQHIAFMGQTHAVDARIYVKDYIALGRYPHFHTSTRAYDKACIDTIVTDLALEKLLYRTMGTLSGGEGQRVHLARALIQEPTLLLLDEPTNHLDPLAKIQLLEHVKRKNITTIAVLHDLSLIEHCANKILLINNGTMSVFGDLDTVLTSYWMEKTFGLQVLDFKHPETQQGIKTFDFLSYT